VSQAVSQAKDPDDPEGNDEPPDPDDQLHRSGIVETCDYQIIIYQILSEARDSVNQKHSIQTHSLKMSIQSSVEKIKTKDFKRDGLKDMCCNTENPILNPQEEIPDVLSKYTVIKDRVEAIDLNEDSWSTAYSVVFFLTGPHDFVSSELLKKLDKKNNPGICK